MQQLLHGAGRWAGWHVHAWKTRSACILRVQALPLVLCIVSPPRFQLVLPYRPAGDLCIAAISALAPAAPSGVSSGGTGGGGGGAAASPPASAASPRPSPVQLLVMPAADGAGFSGRSSCMRCVSSIVAMAATASVPSCSGGMRAVEPAEQGAGQVVVTAAADGTLQFLAVERDGSIQVGAEVITAWADQSHTCYSHSLSAAACGLSIQ